MEELTDSYDTFNQAVHAAIVLGLTSFDYGMMRVFLERDERIGEVLCVKVTMKPGRDEGEGRADSA